MKVASSGSPGAGQPVVVEEVPQAVGVDQAPGAFLVVDDRAVAERSSAESSLVRHLVLEVLGELLARAAASFSGRCSVGHAPGAGLVALQDLAGHGDTVHLAGTVDQAHDRHHHPVPTQGELVGDTEGAVHLDGALHDVVQHLRR